MWNEVRTQEDIDHLLEIYGNFHDSCIVGLEYTSGACVNENKSMSGGSLESRRLDILFHRQWEPIELMLSFTGVHKFCIVGWKDNCFCDIFGCYLALHRDLIDWRDDSLIVWTDGGNFRPEGPATRILQNGKDYSYVIAKNLSWRLLDR